MSEGKFALGGLALLALWLFVGLPLFYHPIEGNEFLGLGAHGWTAVGTLILAAVTILVVVVGLQQISVAREDARNNRTLTVVDRYDFDPILDACLKGLRAAREAKSAPVRGDVITVLNYLESIAIGIEQGVYDEKLAKEHMEYIVVKTYERYLGPGAAKIADLNPVNYIPLTRLYTKWSQI